MMHNATLRHFALERDTDNIVWVTFIDADNPVNRLHDTVLHELNAILDTLLATPCKGMVLQSGRQPHFIAGADVHGFTRLESPQALTELIMAGWKLAERIESLPWPSLALVQGQCLGGGLELALACRWLVGVEHPDTRFALPEVKLGIVPAWGGIRRLPHAIGAPAALELMLSGRSINARQARRLGLVHALVPPRVARQAALQILLKTHPARRSMPLLAKAGTLALARPLVGALSRRALRRRDPFGHYPAPGCIIDLWQHHGGNALKHPETLAMLWESPVTRNLLRVFELQERLRGFGRTDTETLRSEHIHVIGAGVMGGDIAAWCALRGLRVTLQDTSSERLGQAFGRAYTLLRKRLDPLSAKRALDALVPDPHGHGIRHACIVLEAITENLEAKRQLYASILPSMKSDALLATNTSSFTLEQLSAELAQPERLVGLHFFNPVPRMPLVEVVHDTTTSPQATAKALRFVHQIGKLPLPVRSRPGFLVNAALAPYLLQAMRCVDEGISRDNIDASLKAFGMPMGPLELIDTVGLDIARDAGQSLQAWQSPDCLQRLLDAGHLGRKTGFGFYEWKAGQAIRPRPPPAPDASLAQRILEPFFQRAAQLATEVVDDPDLVDAGLIFGAGFPPFRGGPLHYRNTGA